MQPSAPEGDGAVSERAAAALLLVLSGSGRDVCKAARING
jgi:hypothetical protein